MLRCWTSVKNGLVPATFQDILLPPLDDPSGADWSDDRSEQDSPDDNQKLGFGEKWFGCMVSNLRDPIDIVSGRVKKHDTQKQQV